MSNKLDTSTTFADMYWALHDQPDPRVVSAEGSEIHMGNRQFRNRIRDLWNHAGIPTDSTNDATSDTPPEGKHHKVRFTMQRSDAAERSGLDVKSGSKLPEDWLVDKVIFSEIVHPRGCVVVEKLCRGDGERRIAYVERVGFSQVSHRASAMVDDHRRKVSTTPPGESNVLAIRYWNAPNDDITLKILKEHHPGVADQLDSNFTKWLTTAGQGSTRRRAPYVTQCSCSAISTFLSSAARAGGQHQQDGSTAGSGHESSWSNAAVPVRDFEVITHRADCDKGYGNPPA